MPNHATDLFLVLCCQSPLCSAPGCSRCGLGRPLCGPVSGMTDDPRSTPEMCGPPVPWADIAQLTTTGGSIALCLGRWCPCCFPYGKTEHIVLTDLRVGTRYGLGKHFIKLDVSDMHTWAKVLCLPSPRVLGLGLTPDKDLLCCERCLLQLHSLHQIGLDVPVSAGVPQEQPHVPPIPVHVGFYSHLGRRVFLHCMVPLFSRLPRLDSRPCKFMTPSHARSLSDGDVSGIVEHARGRVCGVFPSLRVANGPLGN